MEDIKRKMSEFEEELLKLKQINSELNKYYKMSTDSAEVDAKSVYIGNVDYACTSKELEAHFKDCGVITRTTIQLDKFTGQPKGFAYIEFTDIESKGNALALHESFLSGRQIKVVEKRTIKPGISTTDRGGYRSRGRVVVNHVYPSVSREEYTEDASQKSSDRDPPQDEAKQLNQCSHFGGKIKRRKKY